MAQYPAPGDVIEEVDVLFVRAPLQRGDTSELGAQPTQRGRAVSNHRAVAPNNPKPG